MLFSFHFAEKVIGTYQNKCINGMGNWYWYSDYLLGIFLYIFYYLTCNIGMQRVMQKKQTVKRTFLNYNFQKSVSLDTSIPIADFHKLHNAKGKGLAGKNITGSFFIGAYCFLHRHAHNFLIFICVQLEYLCFEITCYSVITTK